MFSFDSSISVGTLIQVAVLIGGGLWFVWEMRTRMALLGNAQHKFIERPTRIDDQLENLAKVTIEIARQDERMNAQDARIQELSNRLDLTRAPHKPVPARRRG